MEPWLEPSSAPPGAGPRPATRSVPIGLCPAHEPGVPRSGAAREGDGWPGTG